MRTLRYATALMMVVLGAVVLASGPAGLLDIGRWLAANVEILIGSLAAAALLLSIAPRGVAVTATTVMTLCLFVYGARHGWWSWGAAWTVGALVVMIFGARMLFGRENPYGPADPVQRIFRILFPASRRYANQEPPSYLSVVAASSSVSLDFRGAEEPRDGWMEVAVSCWRGDVRLNLPPQWAIVAGRLDLSPTVNLRGLFDVEQEFRYPQQPGTAAKLRNIAQARATSVNAGQAALATEEASMATIVLHVIGRGGSVEVVGRSQPRPG